MNSLPTQETRGVGIWECAWWVQQRGWNRSLKVFNLTLSVWSNGLLCSLGLGWAHLVRDWCTKCQWVEEVLCLLKDRDHKSRGKGTCEMQMFWYSICYPYHPMLKWNSFFGFMYTISEGAGIHGTCLRFQANLVLMTNRSADNLWFHFESLKLRALFYPDAFFCLSSVIWKMRFLFLGQG